MSKNTKTNSNTSRAIDPIHVQVVRSIDDAEWAAKPLNLCPAVRIFHSLQKQSALAHNHWFDHGNSTKVVAARHIGSFLKFTLSVNADVLAGLRFGAVFSESRPLLQLSAEVVNERRLRYHVSRSKLISKDTHPATTLRDMGERLTSWDLMTVEISTLLRCGVATSVATQIINSALKTTALYQNCEDSKDLLMRHKHVRMSDAGMIGCYPYDHKTGYAPLVSWVGVDPNGALQLRPALFALGAYGIDMELEVNEAAATGGN